jgi:toxin ParE1/3/4
LKYQQVVWSEPALLDLHDIVHYLGIESVSLARKQYERIRESAKRLEQFPEVGRVIPELEREAILKYREFVIHPWRLMYRISEERILILALIDGRRNVEDLLLLRNLR